MKRIKRRYIWSFDKPYRINIFIPYRWLRRFYLMVGLFCLLGAVGVGIYFIVPRPALQAWWEGATYRVEELLAGAENQDSDGGASSMGGTPSRETAPGSEAIDDVEGKDPSPIASSPVGPGAIDDVEGQAPAPMASSPVVTRPESSKVYAAQPERNEVYAYSKSIDVAPLDSLLLSLGSLQQDIISRAPLELPSEKRSPEAHAAEGTNRASPEAGLASASPSPARAEPPSPESGLGAITIVSLMPDAYVEVAGQVVTEAPTTLALPWPASYEVTFHRGATPVYETQVRLTAANQTLSFAVDSQIHSVM